MKAVRTDRFTAARCRESFLQFFLEFWPLIAAEKLHLTWYIRELCAEVQEVSERVFANLPKSHDTAWNCPPGTTKSSVVSVAWQPWAWTRMPSCRFITGSYADKLALDLSRKSRDIVTSDKYKSLFPDVVLRDDQNAKGYFANTYGGFRYATGVGGSAIGMHAHIIAVDDPIDPNAALSDLNLAEANTWMAEVLSRRKVNLLLTHTFLIMQRLHQDDPTGNFLERSKKVKHFCVPCDSINWEVKPERFKQFYQDNLLDPVRLPQEALDDAYQEMGEAGYAGQYGQSPTPRGGAMFKVDRLNYSQAAPQQWKRGPIRYWDKAATLGGGAYTAGVKMGLDMLDKVWILDVVRGQWDSGMRENRIQQTAELDGKHVRVVVEKEPAGAGKESAENTIKRLTLLGFRASMHEITGDKIVRADPFSANVNMGNVVLVVGMWNAPYVAEMRFFPRSKYKDQMDASSGGFSSLGKKRVMIGALR